MSYLLNTIRFLRSVILSTLNRNAVSTHLSLAFVAIMMALHIIAEPSQANAEPRIALLISNSNYGDYASSFAGAADGARALAEELKQDSFEVELAENLTKEQMRSALDRFKSKVTEGATALFFFNGIGLEYDRRSYIVPIDAAIWKESDIKTEGFSLDGLLADMTAKGAGVKIVIVDAAHRNPYERNFRDVSRGLAPVDDPSGSLILLSAKPGSVLTDTLKKNNAFITELTKQIRQPGTAEDAFNRTRVSVATDSKGAQIPSVSSSLTREFSFSPSGASRKDRTSASRSEREESSEKEEKPEKEERAERQKRAERQEEPEKPKKPVREANVGKQRAPAEPSGREPTALSPQGTIFKDCGGCPELVVVHGGPFTMGSNDAPAEKPPHLVTIGRNFAIGIYEVTLGEWDRCVEDGACRYRPQGKEESRERIPVGDVSWEDVTAYLRWLSQKTGHAYRLPTEAEWEYAARGGTASRFWWGSGAGTGNANCADCGSDSANEPSTVGSFGANPFGLHDTSGNMAEWVQDCWNENYKGAPRDGSAWMTGACAMKVLRGGYFGSKAQLTRPSSRFRYDSDVRYLANGFRVVRELQ
jgi:formylglycine-generating enzyme required for sulfatase activity